MDRKLAATLVFSSDGTLLAVRTHGFWCECLQVWEVTTGRLVLSADLHREMNSSIHGTPRNVAFAPDSKRIYNRITENGCPEVAGSHGQEKCP
jgi:hypothetical protein